MRLFTLCVALVVSSLTGCGREDEHVEPGSVEDLLRQSGAAELIPRGGLPEDANVIIGTLHLSYDETFGSPSGHFRMALAIVPEEGKKILDFFHGIPSSSGFDAKPVGEGSAVRPLPTFYLRSPHTPRVESWASFKRDFPKLVQRALADEARLSELFSLAEEGRLKTLDNLSASDKVLLEGGEGIQLTFKEFTGTTYYLQNVPKGRAYAWFQTGIDGGKVTQIPIVLDLDPVMGAVTRLDIRIENLFQVFGYF
jgi:hypothetical protein